MTVSITPPVIPLTGDAQAPTSALVTSVSSIIVNANDDRKWCLLTNTGMKDVFLAAGQDAEIDKGFMVPGGGGSLIIGGDFFTLESINGITKAASSLVIVQEAI